MSVSDSMRACPMLQDSVPVPSRALNDEVAYMMMHPWILRSKFI